MFALRNEKTALKAAIFLALTCSIWSCSKDADNAKAKQKIWNNEKDLSSLEQLVQEDLDITNLANNAQTRNRVINMTAAEAAERYGFFEFTAKARIVVGGERRKIDVTEETSIIQGLHGSFTVRQKNAKGEPTRALVYNNGTMFIQNGSGAMRAQGVVKAQHITVRQEAWEPLTVFASYFGPRFGLKKIGSSEFLGREVMDYEVVLTDGPELIESKSGDKAKKPTFLKGQLLIDIKTGVVLKTKLSGKLIVPEAKIPTSTSAKSKKAKEPKSGTINVYLNSQLKTIKGEEQRPKKFVDAIQRHPTDLNPLAFMKGDVRTSTVIGGKAKKKKSTKKKVKPSPSKTAKPKAKKSSKKKSK